MIEVKQLAKKFAIDNPKKLTEGERLDPRLQGRFFHSVRDVSFCCDSGQVLGLLGPNGAGKTTSLRILSTALKADGGSVEINGVDVLQQPVVARRKIGFLSGSTGLYGRLSGRENIQYFAQLHGMSKQAIASRIDVLVDMLDMGSFIDRRCEHYSTGMKQKVAIARTVVHEPEVVILDEPTTGLDIMATKTVLDFIRSLKQLGTPVIFSTHHLDEVEALCDRVVIIDKGQTRFDEQLSRFVALGDEKRDLHASFMLAIAQGIQ